MIAPLVAFALASGAQAHEPEIRIDFTEPASCAVTIAGRSYPIDGADPALRALAAGKPRSVLLRGGAKTPYRCIGGIIYTLQMHGVRQVRYQSDEPRP